jgi:hypothetical protein
MLDPEHTERVVALTKRFTDQITADDDPKDVLSAAASVCAYAIRHHPSFSVRAATWMVTSQYVTNLIMLDNKEWQEGPPLKKKKKKK